MNTCLVTFCYLGFETDDEHLNNVYIMVIHAVSSWVLREQGCSWYLTEAARRQEIFSL